MPPHNAIDLAFERAHREGRAVLGPYLTAGFPQRPGFEELALATLEAGADLLEIGIPFSDPLMDGPAVQYSQQQALEAGITPAECLAIAADIHRRSPKPLLLMGAYNPILAYGVQRFARAAAQHGISGLIVPDIPLEEQAELAAAAEAAGLHLIQMVAPTSSPARVQQACRAASGFVYAVSVSGVTGTRRGVAQTARPLVERIRACTEVPVAVGFGIAGPAQAREVAGFADGVIVGSAFINLLRNAAPEGRETAARQFIGALRAAVEPSDTPV